MSCSCAIRFRKFRFIRRQKTTFLYFCLLRTSFSRVDNWYSRIWLGMSCRCAVSFGIFILPLWVIWRSKNISLKLATSSQVLFTGQFFSSFGRVLDFKSKDPRFNSRLGWIVYFYISSLSRYTDITINLVSNLYLLIINLPFNFKIVAYKTSSWVLILRSYPDQNPRQT